MQGAEARCRLEVVAAAGNEKDEEVLLGSAAGKMSRIPLSSIPAYLGLHTKGVSVIRLQVRLAHSSHSARPQPERPLLSCLHRGTC